jgi:hypothetical protein
MVKRITVGVWRAAQCATAACCLALGACASGGDTGLLILADPGKYQYHNCTQLAEARTKALDRQKELKGLIDKAEQGTGGVFVGAIAYRSDYVAVGQDLQTLDATAREKKCPPAGATAPAPAR